MPDSCCICFSLANKSREFLIGEIGEAADHPDVLRLNRPAVAVAQQHIRGRHSLPRILQGRDKGLDRVSGVLPREFLDAFRDRWPTMRVARMASLNVVLGNHVSDVQPFCCGLDPPRPMRVQAMVIKVWPEPSSAEWNVPASRVEFWNSSEAPLLAPLATCSNPVALV
jgi:hypothetical protein